MSLLWLVHTCCLFAMTGVIWIVQLIHYPSFRYIDRARWTSFHHMHCNWISPVVGPLMLGELLTGTVMAFQSPSWTTLGNVALIYWIFATTAWVSVPYHHALETQYDERVIEKLITTNWYRTVAYSLRCVLWGISI